jgi:uncharacterized membrane protein YGL010W
MQESENWLERYGNSHSDLQFSAIYWLSVPLLVLATVGMLWSLPVPDAFRQISPILNWGSAFLMAAMVYYFIISMSLAIGMLPFILGVALTQIWLLETSWSLAWVSAGLFVVSVIGLYLGHIKGGRIRAVVQDIQLLMIAPVWLLSNLYRYIGIPY